MDAILVSAGGPYKGVSGFLWEMDMINSVAQNNPVWNLFRLASLAILVASFSVRADTWNSVTGGATTSSTSSKVGIGLTSTTALAPQKLTLGIAAPTTEYIFGQYAGTGASTNLSGLRIGGGAGTGDWAGMEVKQSWTTVTNNQINFYTASGASSTQKMTILANGNVGIGTSAPTARLDVNGTAKISGPGSMLKCST